MRRLCFSPSARSDLKEILEYVAHDRPGAAVRLVDRLEATCNYLAENPNLGAACDDLLAGLHVRSEGKYATSTARRTMPLK
jgi:toxin ParE1/3/4